MTSFSASDAALSGVQVIRQHWRAVVGWAVFNIVALVAMVVVTVVVAITVSAAAGGGASELTGGVGGVVALIGTIAVEVVLVAGLFRLMQRPEDQGFIYLRVGFDELRIFAVWLLMLLAIFLIIGAGVFLAGLTEGVPGAAPVIAVLGFLVTVWLGIRFSMAAPASFAERRFAFLQSWRMTRGHVWGLLGMSLLSACLVALISVFALILVLLTLGLTAGFGSLFEALNDPEALTSHPGLYFAQMAFELVLTPFMLVISAAPTMAAYQALRGEAAA